MKELYDKKSFGKKLEVSSTDFLKDVQKSHRPGTPTGVGGGSSELSPAYKAPL